MKNKKNYLITSIILACLICAISSAVPNTTTSAIGRSDVMLQTKAVSIDNTKSITSDVEVYSEIQIQVTSPEDRETVSGTIRVAATAKGLDKLDDMFLTLAGEQITGRFQMSQCIESAAMSSEDPKGTYTKYTKTCWYSWDTSSWRGERVTLTASISDAEGNKDSDSIKVYVSSTEDFVDLDIYPEVQIIEAGNLAEYKITITDNHPLMRCGIALADNPTPTVNEISAAEISATSAGEENIQRCIVYYTYDLEVTGLPSDAEYPKSVTVYQGSSKTVILTIKSTDTGTYRFTSKATLSNNQGVYDSDSATLIVNEYRNCNAVCEKRGYDYGVCKTSCEINEYDLGTRYCPQITDKTLTASKATTSAVRTVSATTAVSMEENTAENTDANAAIYWENTDADADIYWYHPYHCCCGNKGITLKAWPGKSSYSKGDTATIYAKIYLTGNGDEDAKVTGTVKRPDGETETLHFRKICRISEIQKIKNENPTMEISCVGGECWPRCLYAATYKDTELDGSYSVNVYAKSSQGSAETNTGFRVKEDFLTCNGYCQSMDYDYGVCRTSCRTDERNAGTKYCPQLISISMELTGEYNTEDGRYQYMYCCCGNLIPPAPPTPPEEKIKLELQEGWNLITLPGTGKLSLGTCESLYGFVYINGEYLSIKEAREKLGEEQLIEYLRTHSFWAYSFKKCELEFELEEYTTYNEIDLLEGWNFLPITKDMVDKSLQSIQGDCNFLKTYQWNAKKQRWDILDLEDKFQDKQKYTGFIVKTEDSCSLGGLSIMNPPQIPID